MRKALILPLILSLASTARAELLPDEVAIVAMAQSEQSRQLAEYYAAARGVPKSQILLLDGKPSETISRETWERDVRPAIFGWLMSNGLHDKVRCLVTTWDVPLKIDRRAEDSAVVVERRELFAWARQRAVGRLTEVLQMLDTQIPGDESLQEPELPSDASAADLTVRLDAAGKTALERAPPSRAEEKKRADAALERAIVETGGLGALLNAVLRNTGAANLSPKDALQVERIKGQLEGLNVAIQAAGHHARLGHARPAGPCPAAKGRRFARPRPVDRSAAADPARRTKPTPASTANCRWSTGPTIRCCNGMPNMLHYRWRRRARRPADADGRPARGSHVRVGQEADRYGHRRGEDRA